MIPLMLDVTQRPGLAYQHAFDWLAVNLYAAAGPTAYKVNSARHLLQMARRLPEVPALDADPAWWPMVATALGVDKPAGSGIDDCLWTAIGLAEPGLSERGLFDSLRQSLWPGGYLYVIAGGPMSRFLEERRRDGTPILDGPAVVAAARAASFRVVQQLDLHPPAAVVAHYSGEAALALGRRDWRDRRHFAMQRDFVSSRSAAGLSALVCLALERGS